MQTPILAASAGGAAARPFETTATEFAGRKLALRIAPELWLKKLLIGGMTRVYEIGQSFRNEGIDKTHNPEFTTCDFYAVNWNIDRLKSETEEMFASIQFNAHNAAKAVAPGSNYHYSRPPTVSEGPGNVSQQHGVALPSRSSTYPPLASSTSITTPHVPASSS